MARETILTKQLQETICKYVQGGATLPHAAAAAGVSWNTVKDWAKPGNVEREPYASFAAAVDDAKAKWATGAAMQITGHGKRDWKALAWMLERRFPNEYAPPSQRVELKYEESVKALLENLRAKLSPVAFAELLKAVSVEGENG